MDQNQAWNIFEKTGNIEAYLLYLELKNKQNPPSEKAVSYED